jgi:uncharacterized protein
MSRHFPCDHRVDNDAYLSRAEGAWVRASQRHPSTEATVSGGVAVGAALAAVAPADTFKAAFVVIACLIAARFLAGGERWVLGTALPGEAVMSGYGFGIGLASSLMGISGGSLVTMVLTLYGKPIHDAVATAAGLGVPITIAGTLGYVLAGLAGFELECAIWRPPCTQAAEAEAGN